MTEGPLVTLRALEAHMTLDTLYRREEHWPLVYAPELSAALERFWASLLDRDVVHSLTDLTWPRSPPVPVSDAGVSAVLSEWFPFLPALMQVAGPHLVVLGGAVLQALLESDDFEGIADLSYAFNDGGSEELMGVPRADIEHYSERKRAYPRGGPLPCDIDLALVGLSDEAASALLSRCLEELQAKASQGPITVALTRTRHSVSVAVGSRVYQFVLQRYGSVDQALGSADIQPSGVGLWNQRGAFRFSGLETGFHSLALQL